MLFGMLQAEVAVKAPSAPARTLDSHSKGAARDRHNAPLGFLGMSVWVASPTAIATLSGTAVWNKTHLPLPRSVEETIERGLRPQSFGSRGFM